MPPIQRLRRLLRDTQWPQYDSARGGKKATFTVEDCQSEADRGASGRVSVPIGAIQIETPVRRKTGEAFDLAEMRKISQWAHERKIGLHLDGARLFLASAYSGVPVREYTALFDTVYVSMYKYFNAASGAVLAGPKSLLENLFHTRRMFGGGLSHVWPFATVALHYFEGFPERYGQSVATAGGVITELRSDHRFEVDRIRERHEHLRPPRQRRQRRCLPAACPRCRCCPAGAGRHDRIPGHQLYETWNRASAAEILHRLTKAVS